MADDDTGRSGRGGEPVGRNDERFAVPITQVDLGNGYRIAWVMSDDWPDWPWIMADDDEGECGCSCTCCSPHERLGPLPDEWRARIDGGAA